MKLKNFKLEKHKPWPMVLGMDIGTSSLKYVLLKRKGRGLRVEQFGRHSLSNGDEEPDDRLQQVLSMLFRTNKSLKHAKIVLGVDGSGVMIKKESFPALSRKELLQTIYYGIQKEMGKEGETEQDFVHDYLSGGSDSEQEGNTEYLTMAAPGDVVDDMVRPFISQGVVPDKITPNVVAMANLAQFIPELEEKSLAGIIDIGKQRSTIIILKNGKVDFFREIAVGGEDFTKAIMGTVFHEGRAIQFTVEEAAELKVKYGYPLGFSEGMTYKGAPLSEVGAMMRPVVERLIGEIHRSVGFYRDQSGGGDVEALYLIGGGARLSHLSEVLAEKIGVSVSPLSIPDAFFVGGSREERDGFKKKFLEQAVCLSLALESSSEGNLLPESYRKIKKASMVQRSLRFGFFGLMGLMLCVTLILYNKLVPLKMKVADMERRLSHSKNTAALFSALSNQKNLLEGKLGDLNRLMGYDRNLIQVLRLASHAVPKNLNLVTMEYGIEKESSKNVQAEENEKPQTWIVRLRGTSQKPPNDVGIYLAQLIVELEGSGYFNDVKLVKDYFLPEQDEYWFELVGTLKQGGKSGVE